MEQETSLYIPTGVRAEKELFDGFGKRELLQSAAGSLIGGAVAAFLWLVVGSVALTVGYAAFRYFWQCADVYPRPE